MNKGKSIIQRILRAMIGRQSVGDAPETKPNWQIRSPNKLSQKGRRKRSRQRNSTKRKR